MLRRLSSLLVLAALASLWSASLAAAPTARSACATRRPRTAARAGRANTLMTCSGGGGGRLVHQRARRHQQQRQRRLHDGVRQHRRQGVHVVELEHRGPRASRPARPWSSPASTGPPTPTPATSGSAAPNPAQRNLIDFKPPGVAYSTVTASVVDSDSTDTSSYQAFADVTAAVQAGGEGTYWPATSRPAPARTATAAGRSSSPTATRPSPTSGSTSTTASRCSQSGGVEDTDITLTDFLTPETGTVNGRLGVVSLGGRPRADRRHDVVRRRRCSPTP